LYLLKRRISSVPRPVSDAVADGLPLWDTYEALFFLLTGIFLGIVLGFLFPSVWRSFRRRFRRIDKYKPDKLMLASQLKFSAKNRLLALGNDDETDQQPADVDLIAIFVAARYAVQENALRDAANLYLQILGSEKVSRVQTNKAMFELTQVYSMSGLAEKAIETGLELLHRKPAQSEVFRLLLTLCFERPDFAALMKVLETYTGPKSGELAREVSHTLSAFAMQLLKAGAQQDAVALAKIAVRWSPSSLEPKLALVDVTSVVHQLSGEYPADQLVLGFCVDLAELVRLFRAYPNSSPFLNVALIRLWADYFDRHDASVEQNLDRLRNEFLTQLNWDAQSHDDGYRDALKFLLGVLIRQSSAGLPARAWHGAVGRLIPLQHEPADLQTIFVCPACTELHGRFRWKCSSCQRWDTLTPWKPMPQTL
jgi:hypothetical protein